MMTYVTAFIFYTLAMIGIMLIGFVVYKKVFENSKGVNGGLIKILDSTPIGHKKMLLVVQVRNERFLVASGAEHTTFLSKLSNDGLVQKEVKKVEKRPINNAEILQKYSSEIEKENFIPKKEIKFADPKKTRAQELQEQFSELFEKDETPKQPQTITSERKKVIRQLLENLNFDENSSFQSGSKF